MAKLDLAVMGPEVPHLVPCWFYVVPVGGVGASAVGRDDGRDDGCCGGYSGGHPGKRLLNAL